jgi:hypothetical protein
MKLMDPKESSPETVSLGYEYLMGVRGFVRAGRI